MSVATKPAPVADKAAIARLGKAIGARLDADPAAYRIPVEGAAIYAVADFLSLDECARMIEMVDAVARPSLVFDGAYGSAHRSSYSGDVDPGDSFVRMIERRIADLLGIELDWGETVQGQRYLPGQEFKAHYDWFNTTSDYWPDEKQRGGQRCWTAMIYLNDVEEGGATEFPHLNISIPPQAGTLLTWNNGLPDGAPNAQTMHAALPVVRGAKYVVTKWFRTRRWG